MARLRTGRILYQRTRTPQTFLGWVLFFLTGLGRLVYKAPLFLIKIFILFFRFLLKLLFVFKFKKLITVYCLLFTVFFFSFYFYFTILKDLPGPDKLMEQQPAVSTNIYDRSGELLYTIFDGSQKRTLVKLNDIPAYVKEATIAIEDKDFYKHPGFSLHSIFRAIYRNLSHTSNEGGSTITQQLIKNTLLTPEKTVKRKIKEIILSIETEMIFSKDDILQMYLNEVAYGGTSYGIAQAAQTYFGKNIKDISLAEAALLAGLPAAPTKYSPYGASPELVVSRQHQVLDQMVASGFLSSAEAEAVKKERIILAPRQEDIKAPHFVMYVKDLLVQKYGQRRVEQGGLQVTTSLDLKIQQMTQEKVSQEIEKLAPLRIGNGAALVINPQTGEILAMVGSKDYFNLDEDGNVNVTTQERQPGSSIKVITYALALSNNLTPATIISDSPITYYSPGAEPYSPVNYDNRFHGNVTLRTALASSYNVPAVKTLALLGVDKMINLGRKMGITTWPEDKAYGLALTLGAGEVKMTDLSVVYGVLPNLGLKTPLYPILNVTDSKGSKLDGFEKEKPERVLDPRVAYLLTDILKDNQARTPAFGPASLLNIPGNEVAVKTGTSNDKKDNWTIGYTNDFLIAVWVGNNDATPMAAVASGITGASPIWHNIMVELLKNKTSSTFKPPENLVKVNVCLWDGLLSCEGCPAQEEYFLPGTQPQQACDPQEIQKMKEAGQKAQQDKILEGVSTSRP